MSVCMIRHPYKAVWTLSKLLVAVKDWQFDHVAYQCGGCVVDAKVMSGEIVILSVMPIY